MSAKPYKLHAPPAPAGHSDGEVATLPARDHGLIERDTPKKADVSEPRKPAVTPPKPFRVK